MQDPEPSKPPTNWRPTNKLVGGAIIGQALSQVIVAVCDRYLQTPLGPELASAVTTLCYAAAAYFIPNSPTNGA
jgi:hypothetical protein